jgi:ABC-2 type transport system ATP-binding protein
MAILTAEQITKKFRGLTAVHDLNFSLDSHKCIALIGPNGAGKTTTLRMMAGLLTPTSGSITCQNGEKDYRRFIGYLPQHPVFHDWMTGWEFLIFAAKLSYLDKRTAEKRAMTLLNEVGIPDAKDKRIGTYSGGMKQRLGIAQAMIHSPSLLLLDEPVSALDPLGRREILTLVEKLKKRMTILFSTHILADADEVCDEVLLMHKGRIVESGEMDGLRQKYKSSTIELVLTGENTGIIDKLNKLPTVLDITRTRNVLQLNVTNINAARKEILSAAGKEDWPLQSFHINQASLEDMFMKVVQPSCSGMRYFKKS